MTFLFAALALGLPLQAGTAAPVALAPAHNDAARLAGLLVPERAMLDLVTAGARTLALKSRQFEGDRAMVDFVLARMRPEIEKMVREALPELQAEITKILAADLTPAEINDLYTFFASPTGQRLQKTAFDVIAENPMADPATQQSIAVERFMATLTPEDYPPLSAFGASAGARKMRGVNPKVAAASEAWGERLLTKHGARLETLRRDAIADYKKQKGAAK